MIYLEYITKLSPDRRKATPYVVYFYNTTSIFIINVLRFNILKDSEHAKFPASVLPKNVTFPNISGKGAIESLLIGSIPFPSAIALLLLCVSNRNLVITLKTRLLIKLTLCSK